MALFEFLSNKSVHCSRCNVAITDKEAKQYEGKIYCSSCYARIIPASQVRRESVPQQYNSNTIPASSNGEHSAIQEIRQAFDAAKIHYQVQHTSGRYVLTAGVSGKANSYQLKFICKENSKNDVSMRVFALANYPQDRRKNGYRILNDIQSRYRYIRLTLDKDGDVNLEYDIPECSRDIGVIAFEMLLRIMKIVDEIYPEIMRSVWGSSSQSEASVNRTPHKDKSVCTICGAPRTTEGKLCSKCLVAMLSVIESKEYLFGQVTSDSIWHIDTTKVGYKKSLHTCVYCGTSTNVQGRICVECKNSKLQLIMQKALSAKTDQSLISLKMELYHHIKKNYQNLKPEDVAIGPTPSGGAYSVKQQDDQFIFIAEYDAYHREINHTRGQIRR